ncbi:MAG TPA: hypothetical protein VJP78_02170 [Thermoleophilia bacterium]|nr:hypothetical protein [Thermoleophilia bacterium]
MPEIRFVAVVAKVQTMVDGGIRVVLDLPETAIKQAAELMECKRDEIALRVRIERDG